MKIVGLVAFRDEAAYVPYLLASLSPLVDAIVALDDRSTDAGPDLLRDAGARVVGAPARAETFGARRGALLDEGRRAGGSHFVVVDADETFSEPFTRLGRPTIERLRPGQALAMPFRTLWKGWAHYRRGREYDLPLTCIFADDGASGYDDTVIHEARLPGLVARRGLPVSPARGEMFHLQFTAWRRSQVKQAWYRCKELIDGSTPLRVNARYLTTLDGPFVRTRAVDPYLFSHLPPLQPLVDLAPGWHLDEILGWMQTYGPRRFEKLQIWNVPELRAAFEETEGRAPRPARLSPHLARVAGDVYGSGRALARRARARTAAPRTGDT